MISRTIFVWGMALVITAAPASANDVLFSHQLDPNLHPLGSASWKAGGTLSSPVHVLPSGEILALLASAAGKTSLVRWSPAGQELFRREVSLEGGVRGSRFSPNGTLLVITESSLVKVRTADAGVITRRQLGFAIGKATVEASPDGAWFAYPDHIVYAGLDGQRAERAMPLAVPPSARNGFTAMLVTEHGECLVEEKKVIEHPVRGRDHDHDLTVERVLTLIGLRGEVIGRQTLGEVGTTREWFWREYNTNTSVPIPKDLGLVRRRYGGRIAIEAWGERPGGDFLLVVWEETVKSAQSRRLVRLDRSLRTRWSKPFEGDMGGAISPAWAPGLLIHAGLGRVRSYDESAGAERATYLTYPPQSDTSGLRAVALGRDPTGRWIVVEYGAERRSP
jgi:hypothetical protein